LTTAFRDNGFSVMSGEYGKLKTLLHSIDRACGTAARDIEDAEKPRKAVGVINQSVTLDHPKRSVACAAWCHVLSKCVLSLPVLATLLVPDIVGRGCCGEESDIFGLISVVMFAH
jgi:hypothetical protein